MVRVRSTLPTSVVLLVILGVATAVLGDHGLTAGLATLL